MKRELEHDDLIIDIGGKDNGYKIYRVSKKLTVKESLFFALVLYGVYYILKSVIQND